LYYAVSSGVHQSNQEYNEISCLSNKRDFENEACHDGITVNCCCTVRSRYYPRVMIAEVSGTAEQTAQFMKYGEKPGAHIATNVALTNVKKGCNAECLQQLIGDWFTIASKDELWSNWQVLSLSFLLSVYVLKCWFNDHPCRQTWVS